MTAASKHSDYIYDRIVRIANYLVNEDKTIRDAEQAFHVSRSTIHQQLHTKLPEVNPALHAAVQAVLDTHFSERHIRGGDATKAKFANMAHAC